MSASLRKLIMINNFCLVYIAYYHTVQVVINLRLLYCVVSKKKVMTPQSFKGNAEMKELLKKDLIMKPASLEALIVREPVPSGYPNPTRYPIFLSIPDPTRFSFIKQRVWGNPKHQVLPDISGKPEVLGTTRYFGYHL